MDTSLAEVDSIDSPPRVVPAPTTAAAGPEPVQRRGDLDDIFSVAAGSGTAAEPGQRVARLASTGSDSSSSSAAEAAASSRATTSSAASSEAPAAPAALAPRVRVPSRANLYGQRSGGSKGGAAQPLASSSPAAAAPTRTVAAENRGEVDNAGQRSLAAQYGDSAAAAPSVPRRAHSSRAEACIVDIDGELDESTDALLQRLHSKEREFDKKIHRIHHTFQNAGEQLVVRDNIIARLQAELASVRDEVARIPHEYQAREEKLLRRVESMMTELELEQQRTQQARRTAEEEVRQCQAALQAAESQATQQQHLSDDLLRQLRASDAALQEERQWHATALAETRQAYEAKLGEVQRSFRAMEKQAATSHARLEEVERDRAQHQARLLELELGSRRQLSSEATKARELLADRDALREEVEAVRLSMARLLRLMSEVPALAEYLRWNELSSEFVFLGYPTRYFAAGHGPRGTSPGRQRTTGSRGSSPARRRTAGQGDDTSFDRSGASAGPSSSYYHDANVSGLSAVGSTGVEDGVYAGIAAALSKNVWLNGRWAQEMMSIIAAENNFTRLKRIRLLELEEAAQLSEQLPSARDVLECRQPEHHYWIPYAVFTEAQKFKNKYYPRLPAMSHFAPFLIELNKIWRAKLQDRLRVQQQQQQQRSASQHPSPARLSGTAAAALAGEGSYYGSRSRTRDTIASGWESGSGSAASRLAHRSAAAPPPRPEDLFAAWSRHEARLDNIHAEHHRLRREVRLRVSSQRSLQLFRLYDELVRRAHHCLREVLQLAEDFYDCAAGQRAADSEERRRTAAATLRDIHQQARVSVDAASAVEARDRLRRVVEHACAQVCDVGDSLSTQMMSYYSDLHQLIHLLHDRLRHARTQRQQEQRRQGTVGSGDAREMSSCSCSVSSGAATWADRTPDATLSTAELQQRLRELLHDQYGGARGSSSSPAGAADASAPLPAAISTDALLKLASSVLDFGDEVRQEVGQATAALRVIADDAMREADLCRGAEGEVE